MSRLDDVDDLLREVARDAVMPRFQSLDPEDIETKSGPDDIVTAADREAEALLTPALQGLLPGSIVVGEEGVAEGQADPRALEGESPVWLVDPVDGTANFARGSDRFGMMVALCEGGSVNRSWIYFPVTGIMAQAERGSGAFYGGEQLGPKAGRYWQDAAADFSHAYVEEPFKSAMLGATASLGSVRRGHCSAYAYTDLARGLLDLILYYRLYPWDHAPGQLLVE
ncbi:MAG: inositol monophosphatase family protein, partial [Pseudomonadota bacterium]